MRSSGRRPAGDSGTKDFLLRGLVHCGRCGYVLASHNPGPRTSVKHGGYYQCRGRGDGRCARGPFVRHADLDALVDAQTLKRLHDLAEELSRPRRPARPAIVIDFVARRAALLRKRERVVDSIAEGTVTRSQARETIDRIERDLESVERRREEDAEAQTAAARALAERGRHLEAVRNLGAVWSRLAVDERRTIIGLHVERIELHEEPGAKWQRHGRWRHEVKWKAIGDLRI